MAQPRRRLPQSDRLHHGQTTLPVKCEHREDQELSRSRYRKWPWGCNDDLQTPPPKDEKQGNVRIRFSLEKLKDPNIAEIFWATIGGKLAPLLVLENQDTEIVALINSFNTAVTETANNILGKRRPAKKPWGMDNIESSRPEWCISTIYHARHTKAVRQTERTEAKEEYDWRCKTL